MELRQYLAVIQRYWWLLILTTVLAAGAAFYFSVTSPSTYRATTTLEVEPGADPLDDPYSISSVDTVERAAEIFTAKIKSPVLLDEVKDRLELQMDIGGLVSVQQVGDTQFLRISAQSGDPALAQALANTVAQVFIERETQQQQARFQDGLQELQNQIKALEASIADTQLDIASLSDASGAPSEFVKLEITRLESQLSRDQTRLVVLLTSAEDFRLAMARYTDNITVHAPAELPGAPIGSRTRQNTLLGAVTGLMIGVGVAFLLEYLDDTVKSPDDVKHNLAVNVLGALPRLGSNGRPRLIVAEQPRQPMSEAFRNLRTSIQFSSVDRPIRTLLVTSPQPTDGKTFIAANLAVVLAQGGQAVVLVDADLRHPMQHRLFGLPKEPGLSTALLDTDQRPASLQATSVDGLRLVTSGSTAPNPAELLASQRMAEFIQWLLSQADVVVFDSPPVLAVTDAAVLSSLTDGTILVLDCGETRIPAAAQAVERLADVGENLLGAVLNRLPRSSDGYYYYYHYYYGDDSRDGFVGRVKSLFSPRRRRQRARSRERSRTDDQT